MEMHISTLLINFCNVVMLCLVKVFGTWPNVEWSPEKIGRLNKNESSSSGSISSIVSLQSLIQDFLVYSSTQNVQF